MDQQKTFVFLYLFIFSYIILKFVSYSDFRFYLFYILFLEHPVCPPGGPLARGAVVGCGCRGLVSMPCVQLPAPVDGGSSVLSHVCVCVCLWVVRLCGVRVVG